MYRGEVYYIERSGSNTGSEQSDGRPAIIVSNDMNNAVSTTVEVVYLTTQPKKDLPTHVAIRSVKKPSTALCEQISTVSVERVGDYVSTCSDAEMEQIDIALAISLGIDFDVAEKPKKAEVVKPVVEEPKSVKVDESLSIAVQTMKEDVIRAEAERDVYKRLYTELLEKSMR